MDLAESRETHPEIDAAQDDALAVTDSVRPGYEEAIDSSDGNQHLDGRADIPLEVSDSTMTEACDPPPRFPPVGVCAHPAFNAAADSYAFWVADANAPNGGWRVDLAFNTVKMAGGHTYANVGAGLIGTGANGIYGDALFDVDGQANALHFHFEGCLVPTGEETWDAELALTRTSPLCVGCQPATIGRHYTVVHAGTGRGTYTFTADQPPHSCGVGVDLLEVVLPD